MHLCHAGFKGSQVGRDFRMGRTHDRTKTNRRAAGKLGTPAMTENPYKTLPPSAFWRSGVAEAGLFGYKNLWKSPWTLPSDARFSTFGSCFAQHISRALVARGLNWKNAEKAPGLTPNALAQKYNYGVFTARTGNIYTAAQLLTWARLAVDPSAVESIEIWRSPNGRFFDSLRPVIEPDGFESVQEARASLATTARAFHRSFSEAEVFVFTLGLTEGWEDATTGQVWALCPGTGVGTYDPDRHVFCNYAYPRIMADLEAAMAIMREVNPDLRFLLTVSPVPLVATASGNHVLSATTYSKSVLRAVAGDLAMTRQEVDYFPSYEIIASPPSRGAFFEPNLRGIAIEGVSLVMGHFFAGLDISGPPARGGEDAAAKRIYDSEQAMAEDDLVCDEIIMERFNNA